MTARSELQLRDELLPGFLDSPRIGLPFDRLPGLREDAGTGEPLAWWTAGGIRRPVVVRGDRHLRPLFDWHALTEQLLFERWTEMRRPFYTRLPFHYHKVSGQLRFAWMALRYQRRARAGVGAHGFPGWPAEPAADLLRVIAGRYNWPGPHGVSARPWPGGAACAIALSHDIDSGEAWPWVRVTATLERSLGLRSCWNVVPGLYPLDWETLDWLAADGHEIGLHGHDHRGRLPWQPAAAIRRTLQQHRPLRERYRIRGFRSPSLFRTDALYEALEGEFAYDSSVPDAELFCTHSERNGCSTAFPFLRRGVTVLPITMPQDAILMFLGLSVEESLAVWSRKLEYLRRLGGLVLVNTHPDPWFSGSQEGLRLYGRLLENLKALTGAWEALPAQVAAQWEQPTPGASAGAPSTAEGGRDS